MDFLNGINFDKKVFVYNFMKGVIKIERQYRFTLLKTEKIKRAGLSSFISDINRC